MFFVFFLLGTIKCDDGEMDDDESFWSQLEDENKDNNIEVIEGVEGKTYDKARFNLPIARRLNSLFPEVARVARELQDVSCIEFIYEEKFPILLFLDSQDNVVEKIELRQKSKDEIKSLLTVRGFDLNKKKEKEIKQTETKENAAKEEVENVIKGEI